MKFTERDEPNIHIWGNNAKLFISTDNKYCIRYRDSFRDINIGSTKYQILSLTENRVIGYKRSLSGAKRLCNEHIKKIQQSVITDIHKPKKRRSK